MLKIALICLMMMNIKAFANETLMVDVADSNIFILEPISHTQAQKNLGKYYTNEGYRAANFGSKNIARDLFYKACFLGDKIGCLSLNLLNAPINIDNLLLKKQECNLGVGKSCFWLFRHYANENILDSFKTDWYLEKSCRLGEIQACELKMSRFKPFITNKYQILGTKCYNLDAQSCYHLGIAHLFGRGVAKNHQLALKLLQKSCSLGFKAGCNDYIKLQR